MLERSALPAYIKALTTLRAESLKWPHRSYLPVRSQSPMNDNSTVAVSINLGLLSQAWLYLQLFSFRSLLA